MSQATPPAPGDSEATLARELNKDVGAIEDSVPPQGVIEAYTDLPPEKQRGRPVLTYQIPEQIADVILTTLPLNPIYRYSREEESTVAWRIEGTSKALIKYTSPSREATPVYMLPPVGETQLDLRFMMLQSLSREMPFVIDYLPEETAWSILKTTRPEHRAAMEALLNTSTTDSI